MAKSDEIRAAGAVVWRSGDDGPELLLIHRPRGDWTLPKGKLDPGESWKEAAVREVAEETGLQLELGDKVGDVEYRVGGVPKKVKYWLMEAPADASLAVPNREVDEAIWCTPPQAVRILTYDRDIEIAKSAAAMI